MSKKNLIILKIGGSVVTDKKNDQEKIRRKDLERISTEIAQARKRNKFSLIIIHGAGVFGHKIANKFDLNKGYKNKSQIKAISKLRQNLKRLNSEIEKSLNGKGLFTVTFQQSSAWRLNKRILLDSNLTILEKYISLDLVPVLYGDILIDDKLKFSILSGDQIVYYLSKKLRAKKVIIGTDLDGIFESDPKINKNAKLIKKVNSNNIKSLLLGQSLSTDVTNGMKGKVNELIKLTKYDIESEIINISKPNILKKSLSGQKGLGTIIETI
ncbi:MAG: isopentenyl phosphate kinase [Patescibacteria group bacterium]|nr:isopentenyl phosphate kinase [Patescibacteria group bacterium]